VLHFGVPRNCGYDPMNLCLTSNCYILGSLPSMAAHLTRPESRKLLVSYSSRTGHAGHNLLNPVMNQCYFFLSYILSTLRGATGPLEAQIGMSPRLTPRLTHQMSIGNHSARIDPNPLNKLLTGQIEVCSSLRANAWCLAKVATFDPLLTQNKLVESKNTSTSRSRTLKRPSFSCPNLIHWSDVRGSSKSYQILKKGKITNSIRILGVCSGKQYGTLPAARCAGRWGTVDTRRPPRQA
jgi:hypothetical protein